jgi:hypothetical protein
VTDLASGSAESPAGISIRSQVGSANDRWRRVPAWLWLLSVVGQVVIAAALTRYTYFFVDDWIFLSQARTEALGLTYLRAGLFEHFSPISRLLDKLLMSVDPGSWAFAHSLQLLMYGAVIGAFIFTVRTILGNSWRALVLSILFGQSLFLIRMLNWWTASANILPSTAFSLLAIGAYLRWRPSRSGRWLVLGLVSFAAAILDYETALLLPVFLLLIGLLVLSDDLRPRALAAVVWRERWWWLGVAVLEVGGLINYYADYYTRMPRPTAAQTLHFLGIAMVTFAPALVGVKNPEASLGQSPLVIAACCVLVVGVITVVVYTRPRAWRSVAAFAVVVLVTMLPVGINRIVRFGVGIGNELYYQQPLQFMLFVLGALALVQERRRRWPARFARLRPDFAAPARAWLVVGLIAAYGALYITSARAMASAASEPRESRAFVDAFRAGVADVHRLTGRDPALLDLAVPGGILPAIFAPWNHYDKLLPVIDPNLSFDQASGAIYALDVAGRLVPLRFVSLAAGELRRATVSTLGGRESRPAVRGDAARGACVPTDGRPARLNIPLSTERSISPESTPAALRLSVRLPHSTVPVVLLSGPGGIVADQGFIVPWSAGSHNLFQSLSVTGRVRGVDLYLPPSACVDALTLGGFTLAGSPV